MRLDDEPDGETVEAAKAAAQDARQAVAAVVRTDAGLPLSPASEAELVLRRASPWRTLAHLLVGLAVIVGGALGAWRAYRAWQAWQVRSAPMAAFETARVIIGNDARGRGWSDAEVEERPAHEVLVDAFELDVTEVTVEDYAVCARAGACAEAASGKLCNAGRPDLEQHPINCVTHAEAERFCQWARKRLPTEVEWEYAAGGSKPKRLFPWGNDLPDGARANVCGLECRHGAEPGRPIRSLFDFDDGSPATAAVGSYPAGNTPEGLQDMAGNVWEWTSSPTCAYPDHDCPPGEHRVIRGGGWTHRYVLSPEVTTREELIVSLRSEGVGFRCARSAQLGP